MYEDALLLLQNQLCDLKFRSCNSVVSVFIA